MTRKRDHKVFDLLALASMAYLSFDPQNEIGNSSDLIYCMVRYTYNTEIISFYVRNYQILSGNLCNILDISVKNIYCVMLGCGEIISG